MLIVLFDELTLRLERELLAAFRAESCWEDGARSALTVLLRFSEEKPDLARFLIVDSPAGDARMLARRRRVLERLAGALDASGPSTRAQASAAPFGGAAIVAMVLAILHARLLEEPVPPLRELCGAFMGVIVLGYHGVDAARAELVRPLASELQRCR